MSKSKFTQLFHMEWRKGSRFILVLEGGRAGSRKRERAAAKRQIAAAAKEGRQTAERASRTNCSSLPHKPPLSAGDTRIFSLYVIILRNRVPSIILYPVLVMPICLSWPKVYMNGQKRSSPLHITLTGLDNSSNIELSVMSSHAWPATVFMWIIVPRFWTLKIERISRLNN